MVASTIFPPIQQYQTSVPSPSPALSHSRSNLQQSGSQFSPSKQQPNAHPYAIKTTSTALLSRSTSSAAHSSSEHRYVPPASPSPSPTKGRFSGDDNSDGEGRGLETRSRYRPSRHRYSRSLTTDSLPAPLPPPPGAPGPQYSSYTNAYNTSKASGTRHGTDRTMSIGSNSGASEDEAPQQASLPSDPKTWTTQQLFSYLESSVSVGDGDDALLHYVRDKGLTGRAFMRLIQSDMDESNLSRVVQIDLLSASRTLRRQSLRGKIFGSTPEKSDHEEGDRTINMNQGDDDNGVTSQRRRTRSRQSSIASDSSQSSVSSSDNGRVRDMVDELERKRGECSGENGMGMTEEDGTPSENVSSPFGFRKGSVSPRKHMNASHLTHTHSHSRSLPQRPSVNDLFGSGPPSTMSDASTPEGDLGVRDVEKEKERDGKIGGMARRNVHGREARLLPLPPTPTGGNGVLSTSAYHTHHANILTASHTGASYPLPSSPLHSLQANKSEVVLPPGDYELGFRHATSPSQGPRLPHAQTYVVRHNPSPSNTGSHNSNSPGATVTAGNKLSRLLPYPPIVQETALHHPRPRRLVGTGLSADGDTDSNVSDGLSAKHRETDARSITSTTNTGITSTMTASTATDTETDAWETAQESSSDDGEIPQRTSNRTEEPTIAELLAQNSPAASRQAQAPSTPISGAQAWEMELGDTVKRVGGAGPSRSEPPLLISSTKIIKGSVDEIGRKKGRAAGTATGASRRDQDDGMRRGGIVGLFSDFHDEADAAASRVVRNQDEKSTALDGRQNAIAAREEAITQREEGIRGREMDLDHRQATVEQREKEVEVRQEDLQNRESQLKEWEVRVGERGVLVGEREVGGIRREDALKVREEDLIKEELLEFREEDLRRREESLKAREEDLNKREEALNSRQDALNAEARDLQQRADALHDKDAAMATLEYVLREREDAAREKEAIVAAAEEAVATREASAAETQRMFEVRVEEAGLREKAVDVDAEENKVIPEKYAEEKKKALEKEDLEEEAETFREEEKTTDERQQALAIREKEVDEREQAVAAQHQALDARLELEEEQRTKRTEREACNSREKAEKADRQCKEEEEVERRRRSPPVGILRTAWTTFVLPIVGEERTPVLFRSSTSSIISSQEDSPGKILVAQESDDINSGHNSSGATPVTPQPYLTSTWSIRRDAFFGRFMDAFSGGRQEHYLVLMSIGVVVVVLRAIGKRGWGLRR